MDRIEILKYIEDNDIKINNSWFYHATKHDSDIVKNILNEGIKSAYLRNEKGNHFNGKYYISLCKYSDKIGSLFQNYIDNPKIIIDDIEPLYADIEKLKVRKFFINSRIPLRTSEWNDEYQEYLIIDPSKFIALEYSLSNILISKNESNEMFKKRLLFLQDIIRFMIYSKNNLPIYDSSSNSEINKEKVLELSL